MLSEVTRLDPTLMGLMSSQETRTQTHSVNLMTSRGKMAKERGLGTNQRC